MSDFINYSFLFLLSFIATSFFTWLLIFNLPSFGMVDIPDPRRVHNRITPRGGGIAIVIVVIVGLISYEYFTTKALINSIKILPLLLIISTISFLDDLISVPVFIRLIIHIICSTISIVLFLSPALLFHHELPLYIDFVLSIIYLTTFLNIYNFLDGIDGISGAESIHLSITILILCYLKYDTIINTNFIIILNIIILGCSIGFLIFNWHPAKIFIGDVGSISLGFLLGLCLLLISASSIDLFIASSIASLYYMTDGGLTILIRLLNKEKIWQPHLKHFFQKAVKNGKSHREVVCRIIICNILLMVLSITSLHFPLVSTIFAVLVVMVTIINFAHETTQP
ncbi:MraY family glycosyltransferase [Rickettsia endosymbiont of Culicoides newsteadi]|uniref:UDP-phosphate alpha-N-acetylglucosaminyltransferase n=1 Tax=Rickettsia endosymbiont of Culicoides newsteadi TaxID=1961830 RepID=UPI000B9BCC7A|nr:UDP-phosphate alpha-N-acetylglucosaminyltransferase [Rickettsia endosymbiont of Culicoides newsteadi]MDN3029798.1 UDP-phosphate alpha-N-acetylglucosaminyltransferase [Candidatus Tisiphia sp.]OZG31983.1 UDP-phosphate alpha-N-acetylglucosaminyltransferase [Rickettsia endosymbiont of Culicoides newsteadi]